LNVGRSGHGLGMQLTEPPSNMPGDETELVPGMVMTVEPGYEYSPGKMIVHEENLVITEDGCELLTRRAPREMPVIT
jgi:Xaa-Pro aminopeptidase